MNILVTGSSSGLGLALMLALRQYPQHTVFDYDLEDGADVRTPDMHFVPMDLDVLINCAGINHIEWLADLRPDDWDAVMDVNAKGIYKMSQACLSRLIDSKGTIVNIVSNAAHIPMTCSLAYNASKAAAEIMTRQMARELTKRYGITVFGIAPNKMAGTGMSRYIEATVPGKRGWTAQQAEDYQRDSLLAGAETPITEVADFVAYLLSNKERHRYLTGCILPYGA
jgi:NAD(P)-dependent dehydrogenase (short-subunit alcohol dehydrogenase family)